MLVDAWQVANALILSRVLPTHHALISCASTTFPETAALFTRNAAAAEAARFDSVVLLATAPAADHAVCPLNRVVLGGIVAPIARKHLVAAREAEPPV